MADTELVVTIEPELPLADPSKETSDPVAELKAQFAELQTKTASTEAARLDAERRASAERAAAEQARKETADARAETADSHLNTVTTGIDAAKTDADAATAEYQSAMEAGDWARAAKAQRRMASAESKITRLEEAKSDIEARRGASPETITKRTEAPSDPVEAFVSSRTDATKQWLRSHPDHARALALSANNIAGQDDTRRAAKLNAGHNDAIAEGLSPDTPDYFAHVEKFIGLRGADDDAAPKQNGATPQPKRRTAVPVAPVQNGGGGTNGGGAEVRLSAGEARSAQDGTLVWNYDDTSPQKKFKKGDPIGIQEMARRKQEMTKQGLYDKSFTEA